MHPPRQSYSPQFPPPSKITANAPPPFNFQFSVFNFGIIPSPLVKKQVIDDSVFMKATTLKGIIPKDFNQSAIPK